MGSEIIFVVLPIALLLHLAVAVAGAPREKRLSRLLTAVGVVLACVAVFAGDREAAQSFCIVVGAIYFFIMLPISLIVCAWKGLARLFRRRHTQPGIQPDGPASSESAG